MFGLFNKLLSSSSSTNDNNCVIDPYQTIIIDSGGSDAIAADASFLFVNLIDAAIAANGANAIMICSKHDANHYSTIATKLGFVAMRQTTNNRCRLVSLLSLIDASFDTSLDQLSSRLIASIRQPTEDDSRPLLIAIDSIDYLIDLGIDRHRLRCLLLALRRIAYAAGGWLVVGCESSSQSSSWLLSIADIHIDLRLIAGGFAKDVTGEVCHLFDAHLSSR
jgi:hypothetical protein